MIQAVPQKTPSPHAARRVTASWIVCLALAQCMPAGHRKPEGDGDSPSETGGTDEPGGSGGGDAVGGGGESGGSSAGERPLERGGAEPCDGGCDGGGRVDIDASYDKIFLGDGAAARDADPMADASASGDGEAGFRGGIDFDAAPDPSANLLLSEPMQTIDGFGVSNAWLSAPHESIRSAVYDALFSVSKGAGLSMLRTRIPFRERRGLDDAFIHKSEDGTYQSTLNEDGSRTFSLNWSSWDLNNTSALIRDIKSRGSDYQLARFMSTPWTPPNNSVSRWKLSNPQKTIDYVNTPEVGGYLDPVHYADYADVLADYVLGFRAKMGVDLDVLSIQNEPNFQCSYESADWTAEQFHAFFLVLKTEFAKKKVFEAVPNLRIMAPEHQNVSEELIIPILDDPNTADLLGIVGVHQYEVPPRADNYAPSLLPRSVRAGKPVWMTEFSTLAWAADPTIADGLIVANLVHLDLVAANMSGFNYWWSWGHDNGSLVLVQDATYTVPKRLYALGQFSRFVRPGWQRIQAPANPAPKVKLSAFRNANASQAAVVAINLGSDPATVPLTLDRGQFGTISVYRTSATESLKLVGSMPGGASVEVTLAPSSVTTFSAPLTP